MNERRLHPFTVLRFLRKTLVVYLLPLVQVLFERNWTALHTALRQDALLFLLLCAVSWGILRVSSWSLDDTGVLSSALAAGHPAGSCPAGRNAGCIDHRPAPALPDGRGKPPDPLPGGRCAKAHPFGLPAKADAEAVADQLMPLVKPTLHRPAGGERAALGFWGPTASPRWPCLCWPCARPGMFRTGTLPFLPRSR